MRRCSTVQTLLPVEYAANKNNDGCDVLTENFKSTLFLYRIIIFLRYLKFLLTKKDKEFVARQIKKELIVEKLLTIIISKP